jgi:hypothetical protein
MSDEDNDFVPVQCLREQDPGSWCGCEDKCMFADGIPMDERIEKAIQKMEHKYYQLVAYARKRPEDRKYPAVERLIKEVEFLYEEEVSELKGIHGDWQHGFHSGALAAFRYMQTINDMGVDQADEEFPFLDT